MISSKLNIRTQGEIQYITFPNLDEIKSIKHLFTTRYGGVSSDHLSTMNLSFSRGDDPNNVIENYRRISELLECEMEDFVASVQTHSNGVKIITSEDRGKGIVKPCDYDNVDGLITNVKGVVLVTYFADCVPLFFVDEKQKVIGLAHSGYKGTILKIGKNVVKCMVEKFQCNQKDIKVAIGPSICKQCYEVGEEVAEAFKEAFPSDINKIAGQDFNKKGKWKIDLWKANEIVLQQAGIAKEHILVTDICTCCNKYALFSHRGSQGKRGNLAAFLTLK